MRSDRAFRPFYYRLALAGALVVAIGMSIYASTAIPAGDPRAPLFIPGTLVVLALAMLMRRSPKALWIGVAAGPVALVVFTVDPFRLLHADSFIDFVPSVLMLAGTATAFVGSTVELVQRRRHTERSSTLRERVFVAVGAVTLIAVASYSAFVTFSGPVTAALPGGRTAIVLEADESSWEPRTLSISTRADTLILVRNPNWIAHTFSSSSLGIDSTYIAPRTERVIEIRASSAGMHNFVCDVTGHESMVGTLRAS